MKTSFKFSALLGVSLFIWSGCGSVTDGIEDGQDVLTSETAKLSVVTRGNGNETVDGRIYLFNGDEQCVAMLTPNSATGSATAILPAGTYDVYALAGPDLSEFGFPTQAEATMTREMTFPENGEVGDLQYGHVQTTLKAGELSELNMELHRLTFRLDQVTLKDIPEGVTAVEFSIKPLAGGLRFNGKSMSKEWEMKVPLVADADEAGTWKAAPQRYGIPWVGSTNVVFGVKMTSDEGDNMYSFISESPLVANTKVSISATYTGVQLNATLQMEDWGDDDGVEFSFDSGDMTGTLENNMTEPVQGQQFCGYYVATVDEMQRKAVLVRKSQEAGYTTLEGINEKMAAINKPSGMPQGVTVGNWRLPTVGECDAFVLDPLLPHRIFGPAYFCTDGEAVNNYCFGVVDGKLVFTGITSGISETSGLRPVIDITY